MPIRFVSCAVMKTHKGGVFCEAGAGPCIGVGYTSPFCSKKSSFKAVTHPDTTPKFSI